MNVTICITHVRNCVMGAKPMTSGYRFSKTSGKGGLEKQWTPYGPLWNALMTKK